MKGTALITGGAKRIGAAIALHLADLGYNIALHYNSSHQKANELSQLIRQKGVKCQLFQCDIGEEKDMLQLIPTVYNTFKNLNLLINNASIFHRATLQKTDAALFTNHFNINLKAPFFLSRDFAQQCQKGHIINILDTKITQNDKNYLAYTLSKKGLAELTKTMALELVPNIRVNGIAPGYILPPAEASEKYLAKRKKNIPLKQTGNMSYIIQAISYLIDNKFVTGEILYVDGGEHL